jgi:hypothetical protein
VPQRMRNATGSPRLIGIAMKVAYPQTIKTTHQSAPTGFEEPQAANGGSRLSGVLQTTRNQSGTSPWC